jgi:hypothetical protein
MCTAARCLTMQPGSGPRAPPGKRRRALQSPPLPAPPCRLAASVIGSDARGTMRSAVAALKRTYEVPLFPQLDAIRWVARLPGPVVGRLMGSAGPAVNRLLRCTVLRSLARALQPGAAQRALSFRPRVPS